MSVNRSSNRHLLRILNFGYALGLLLINIFWLSGRPGYVRTIDQTPLILAPIVLTVALLAGQALIAHREMNRARGAPILVSRAWIPMLIIYIGATWFIFQMAHLRLQG